MQFSKFYQFFGFIFLILRRFSRISTEDPDHFNPAPLYANQSKRYMYAQINPSDIYTQINSSDIYMRINPSNICMRGSIQATLFELKWS